MSKPITLVLLLKREGILFNKSMDSINKSLSEGEYVMVDTRNLSSSHLTELERSFETRLGRQSEILAIINERARMLMNELINEKIKHHKAWLDSLGSNGTQLYLSEIDLSGIDLSNKDLTSAILPEVTFKDANLENVILNYSNLASCDFFMANLENAQVVKAIADYADFEKAMMQNANLFRGQLSLSQI